MDVIVFFNLADPLDRGRLKIKSLLSRSVTEDPIESIP